MTLHDYLDAQYRTNYRALRFQAEMYDLADAAGSVGCASEAHKLRAIGDRAWGVAERYLCALYTRIS